MPLTSIDKAREIIFDNINASPLGEYVNIEDCSMRILDEDIHSQVDLPPFDRSKMDGWAIRSKDSPGKFRITGYLQAGAVEESFMPEETFTKDHELEKLESYKIMTGAPLIKGADAVLQIENCIVSGDYVEIKEKVKKSHSIAPKGEDMKKGQLLIKKGTKLNSHYISLLASSGYRKAKVKKKLVVSIIVTGNELLEPSYSSEEFKEFHVVNYGQIFNSNAFAFISLCKENGLEPHYVGTAGDTMESFKDKINQCDSSDIIILSGGVSVGDHDLVQEGLSLIGAKELFYKVAAKPGKPLLFCKKNKTLIFGFPGNPVSSMVGFREFLIPAIRKIYGLNEHLSKTVPAYFSGSYVRRDNREHFININLFTEGDKLIAKEQNSNSSGDLVSYAASNGILRVSNNKIEEGEIVHVEIIDL